MRLPTHIAIIMDGNGRWAKQRNLPRNAGHQAGQKALRTIIEALHDKGIPYLTVYAFSSENWQRPATEVSKLMQLLIRGLKKHISELHANQVRINFIGRRDRLQPELSRLINDAEQLTTGNCALCVNVALDYGGQWDICQAAETLRHEQPELPVTPDNLTPYLCLSDQPAPDLLIRTGGETRISNFLLWQLAYAEMVFTDTLWPDFGLPQLEQALKDYASRDRRYGQLSEHVSDINDSSGINMADLSAVRHA